MSLHHYLRPLLMPASVALVGASERAGSLGRVVFENLLDAGYTGEIHAINPDRRRVLGHKSLPRIATVGRPIDLVVVATPCTEVIDVLDEAARSGAGAAVVLSPPPADEGDARRWKRDVGAFARRRGIRWLGPHAFGVMRPSIGLNATAGVGHARAGRLALVAQSGAMCTALLDFAAPAGIGFSSVVALGGGVDIGFGELLDALLLDTDTDAILLYVESVRDARRFLSALRAAARTKPVVVLKAGRSMEAAPGSVAGIPAPSPDLVFDAAMHRAGAVRVKTYAQLFAAARLLSMGNIARGDRLAIVTNGHAPGILAADIAADRGIPLARLSGATVRRLSTRPSPGTAGRTPINVRGDAPPERLADAVEAALADDGVDAVLALHVQRPLMAGTDAARAVANVARRSTKPVLGAWLGALGRPEVQDALEAGNIASFTTPENAVDAFSFVAAYRRHQQWLLEVAPPTQEPVPPDRATVEHIRVDALSTNRMTLTVVETHRLLEAFGLPVARARQADTLKEALDGAREVGYPVRLRLDMESSDALPLAQRVMRRALRDGRMVSRAYGEMFGELPRAARRHVRGVIVQRDSTPPGSFDVAFTVHADPVFGPVMTLGNSAHGTLVERDRIVVLPPLNARLAVDLIRGKPALRDIAATEPAPQLAVIAGLLLKISSLVCAVPWLRGVVLDPVHIGAHEALIGAASAHVDPRRPAVPGDYRHMAIHPYPVELVTDVTLRDGTVLHVRPIMPEDARLEREFVAGLSDEARYFRFFYRLPQLTPAMLARFTQVDYDREIAFVALHRSPQGPAFAAVARYVANADGESAEYAIVVGDAWQRRGLGHLMMQRLIAQARRRGLKRLEGAVLRANADMLRFVTAQGFVIREDAEEPDQVMTVLDLETGRKSATGRVTP